MIKKTRHFFFPREGVNRETKCGKRKMRMRCKSVKDIVDEANRILFSENNALFSSDVEYFFRGESMNFKRKDDGVDLPLDTSFPCYLDRKQEYIDHERDFYQEAMRLNITSFETDKTMVERVTRMQHYQVPTRFCDLSSNVLMAAMFACGGGDTWNKDKRDNGHDGYIRIIKVRKDRIKSFTSDIITAISHLPLVKRHNINPSIPDGLSHLRYEITNSRSGFSMNIADFNDGLREAKEQLQKEIQQVWPFKPIWNSERIRRQEGIFLAFGCKDNKAPLNPTFSIEDYDDPDAPSYGIAQIDYIQLHFDYKKYIREELRYFGVPIESVYPDLSSASMEIENRLTNKLPEK